MTISAIWLIKTSFKEGFRLYEYKVFGCEICVKLFLSDEDVDNRTILTIDCLGY